MNTLFTMFRARSAARRAAEAGQHMPAQVNFLWAHYEPEVAARALRRNWQLTLAGARDIIRRGL